MPNPIAQYPLAPPSIQGGNITVDTLLKQPLRLTREITDYVALGSYFMGKVFRNAPSPQGGAVLYYPLEANDLYGDLANRDVQDIAPASEFPIVGGTRKEPLVEKVKKYGGKFFLTDEDVRRNDPGLLRRKEQQLANLMALRLETTGIRKLEAAADSRSAYPVPSWKQYNRYTTQNQNQPITGFVNIAAVQEGDELGVKFDTLIASPLDVANLRVAYGSEFDATLASAGITTVISTPRKTAGDALVVAAGEVGFVAWEVAPTTESWRDMVEQVNWVQHWAEPAIAVDNTFAARRLTGIAA